MKMLFVFLSVIASHFSFAQLKVPVKWSFSSRKINATTYEVHLTATLEDNWHIYSQTTPDGGPVATTISFVKNPLITVDGAAKEVGKLEQHYEPIFSVDVKQYSEQVDFVQTIKLKAKAKTTIRGAVEYMTCNDRQCLPPSKQTFSVALN